MKTLISSLAIFSFLVFSSGNLNSEPRRLVLEFCTGTWCGYCPCGDVVAEQILTTYPNTIVIAYHGASSDPWQNFNGNAIRSMLGFSGYPTGIFDRTNHPGNGSSYPYITYNMWSSMAQQRYTNNGTTIVNVSVTSNSYNSSTRTLNTTVNATALQSLTSQYKIVFVLTEDNVVYPQYFYSSCGTPGYHNDYIHYWIARNVVNGASGENMNTGTWNQNQTITKSISTTLDNTWVAENCKLNVIVYRDSSAGLFLSSVEQGVKQNVTGLVGISSNNNEVPSSYTLSQNYPNPFNPTTNIKFTLPKDGQINLKIYDVLGNEVATYADGFFKAGSYNAEVNASNWASGVYFYKLVTEGFTETKKMNLVK